MNKSLAKKDGESSPELDLMRKRDAKATALAAERGRLFFGFIEETRQEGAIPLLISDRPRRDVVNHPAVATRFSTSTCGLDK